MRSRLRIIGLAALGAGATLLAVLALWAPPRPFLNLATTLFPGCLYQMEVSAPLVALTIDDGPDPVTTPLILEELARHRAQATFFLITDRIAGNETIVHEIVRGGHELGNHLTRDEPSIGLPLAEFEASLLRAHGVLAVYGTVGWVRPGSGWYSRPMIEVIGRHGYRCALGSVYPYDTSVPWPGFASGYILRNLRPGAIVILHDGGTRGWRTIQVLRAILPELARRGYRVVTLSTALPPASSRLPGEAH